MDISPIDPTGPPSPPSRTDQTAQRSVLLDASIPSQPSQAVLVVGFDRRPESLAALATAAELGGRLAAELRVVHAVDLTDYPNDPDRDDWEARAQEVLQHEQQLAANQLAEYPFGWSYVAVRDDPVKALSRIADKRNALMIVVGSRGEGWHRLFERMTSPSVSHRLIDRCRRPVLVVCHSNQNPSRPDAGQAHNIPSRAD